MAKSKKKHLKAAKEKEQMRKFAITVAVITLAMLLLLFLLFSNL